MEGYYGSKIRFTSPLHATRRSAICNRKVIGRLEKGEKHQTLLGATGTGKTFTVSNVIKEINKPTLVMAHNKTLAGQLYSEFKQFFPNNAIEYFVSYYDYFQPEAYVAHTDTYIEKDASINDEIDKLRHSATSALFERYDVLIVASVSCIYGLGSPEEYRELVISLRTGMEIERNELLRKFVDIQYVEMILASLAAHFGFEAMSLSCFLHRVMNAVYVSNFSVMKLTGFGKWMH